MSRWAWAEVDLRAIKRNVVELRRRAPDSQLWAAVKADAYGHGAAPVAAAALAAGATGLCVALAQEGVALREAGIGAPILVLSEQPPEELDAIVRHRLAATVYSSVAIDALQQACERANVDDLEVHLKVDTGMRRVGCTPAAAVPLADAIGRSSRLGLAGVFTHLPVADEPNDPFTEAQLNRFHEVLEALGRAGHHPLVHIANSAGLLAHTRSHRSAVRIGIAMYGLSPGPAVEHQMNELVPALSLHARASFVKRVAAGERISYGLQHELAREATVVTVPIGYADGVPRRLSSRGGQVLIGGRRHPMVGVVTMDQLVVDVGDQAVERGDAVVLIGCQGDEEITTAEWATRLDTITYEVVCGISHRIERRYREHD